MAFKWYYAIHTTIFFEFIFQKTRINTELQQLTQNNNFITLIPIYHITNLEAQKKHLPNRKMLLI